MKVGIKMAVLAIGSCVARAGHTRITPFEGEGVSRTRFMVPWHHDAHGDSTEFVVSGPNGGVSLLGSVKEQGEYRLWGEGEVLVEVLPGDRVQVRTTCSRVEGVVMGVKNPFIYLGDVFYDGPWANFDGGTCLTFGGVRYPHLTGEEPVIATAFRGNLGDYRFLREKEAEERALEKEPHGYRNPPGWGWEKTFLRRWHRK